MEKKIKMIWVKKMIIMKQCINLFDVYKNEKIKN